MRPQTYENKAEAKVMSYVFAGRSGLENTSFALLDPDGKKLTRGSRTPSMTYGSTERFAKALEETAAKYTPKARAITALPVLRDLRIALNVAAADMRPLVIVRGKDAGEAAVLRKHVEVAAWSNATIGMCHYVVLENEVEFEGLEPDLGVTVVQPDPYGMGGKILSHAKATHKRDTITASMADGIAKYEAEARRHRDHIREARQEGITWDSKIPVSDPHERKGKGRKRDSLDDEQA